MRFIQRRNMLIVYYNKPNLSRICHICFLYFFTCFLSLSFASFGTALSISHITHFCNIFTMHISICFLTIRHLRISALQNRLCRHMPISKARKRKDLQEDAFAPKAPSRKPPLDVPWRCRARLNARAAKKHNDPPKQQQCSHAWQKHCCCFHYCHSFYHSGIQLSANPPGMPMIQMIQKKKRL